MTRTEIKNLIKEIFEELAQEAKKEAPKKEAPKKTTPKVSKKDLDQTKDDKITTGDAVVAAKKSKIAKDPEDQAFYKKIQTIVNKRLGNKVWINNIFMLKSH